MSETVLVTGASRGIGREVSRLLVRLGHPVVGVHRTESQASRSLAEELGDRLRLRRAELNDQRQVEKLVGDLYIAAAPLAGVVLCAGSTYHGDFVDEPDGPDPLMGQIRSNLAAPLVLLRSLLRDSVLARGTSVVMVTSNLARRGLPQRAAYSAAKGGLESAVRSLAHELGPFGIRVNAVAPGLLRTDMTKDMDDDAYATYASSVPLGRVGEATDVAPIVAFLLGPESGYITGQTIDVDGGWAA